MHGIIQHIAKNHRRHLAVFTAFIVVMLTSCAFKGSIKSLAGIPANTEQNQSKKTAVGSDMDACVYGEVTDAKIATYSSNANDLLPVALVVTALFSLVGFNARAEAQLRAGYVIHRIPNPLPIFLQHRQLII